MGYLVDVIVNDDGSVTKRKLGGTLEDASAVKYADNTTAEFQKQKMASEIEQNASDIENLGEWELVKSYSYAGMSGTIEEFINRKLKRVMVQVNTKLTAQIAANRVFGLCVVGESTLPKRETAGSVLAINGNTSYFCAITKNKTNGTVAFVNGSTALPIGTEIVGQVEWSY